MLADNKQVNEHLAFLYWSSRYYRLLVCRSRAFHSALCVILRFSRGSGTYGSEETAPTIAQPTITPRRGFCALCLTRAFGDVCHQPEFLHRHARRARVRVGEDERPARPIGDHLLHIWP